jgi:pyridoxamine 5'-phosphate oxidase
MTSDRSLDLEDLSADPVQQFDLWYKEYLETNPPEPSAMALATATPEAEPSVRFVLLKEYNSKGFVFFSNFDSEKGQAIARNARAALAFYWNVHNRQVRVTGRVEKLSDTESDRYFSTRPLQSQLSAWASQQSRTVASREILETRMKQLEQKYSGKKVPRPPYWGGFLVRPERIEFWQGRTGRLHDRFLFELNSNGWDIRRLCP